MCAVYLSGKSATVDSRVTILLTSWPSSDTPGGGSHESGAEKEADGFEGIWLWVGKQDVSCLGTCIEEHREGPQTTKGLP